MYQKADAGFIDYQQYRFGSGKAVFRGPPEPIAKPYVVFLGAAQTFGRFVELPFPKLLQQRLGMRCVNLGAAGGGPDLFLQDEEILALCAGAEACVLQIMSGRSVSNRFYEVDGRRNAVVKSVSPELREVVAAMERNGRKLFAHDILAKIEQLKDENLTRAVFDEVRSAWVAAYVRLLANIDTHRILFWFSERSPDSRETYSHRRSLMKFPQLVDKEMIEAVRPFSNAYVECVTSAGMPQSLLRNGAPMLFNPSGAPKRDNPYYPSPEMHQVAAEALCEILGKRLTRF